MSLDTGASLKEVVDKAEQIDADLQNKKQLIATAVTGKDVPTNGSDSFQKMADNIDSIKTKLPILEGDVGVTEDTEGNVYGVDRFEERYVYPDLDKTILTWTKDMSSSTVVVDNQGYVYTCSNDKAIKSTPDGELVWSYFLGNVQGIAVDNQGCVYASSVGNTSYNGKVIKLTSDGELVWSYNLPSSSSSGYCVSVDSQGYAYVGRSSSVEKLDLDGKLVWSASHSSYSYSMAIDNQGYVYTSGIGSADKIVKISPSGKVVWSYSCPYSYGIAVDNQGYIYGTSCKLDSSSGKIIKLNSSGQLVSSYSCPYAYGIAVDTKGFIYSTSRYTTSSGKIIKSTSDFELVWEYELSLARSVAVDNQGYIYICGNGNVIKLKDNYILEKLAVLKEREVQ